MSTFIPNQPPNGPENIGDILAKLFATRGWGRKADQIQLEEAWLATIGPEFGPKTRINSLKRGIAEIEVNDPILLQELVQFHQQRLLTILKQKVTNKPVKQIRFRFGNW
jgi:predicted nucleic acid-binding Zn ribbon protein